LSIRTPPIPTGFQKQLMVCVMTFRKIGLSVRKASPTLLTLAMLTLVVGFATVGLAA